MQAFFGIDKRSRGCEQEQHKVAGNRKVCARVCDVVRGIDKQRVSCLLTRRPESLEMIFLECFEEIKDFFRHAHSASPHCAACVGIAVHALRS